MGIKELYPELETIYEVSMPDQDPTAGHFSKELINRILVTGKAKDLDITEIRVSKEALEDIRNFYQDDVEEAAQPELFSSAPGRVWNLALRRDKKLDGTSYVLGLDTTDLGIKTAVAGVIHRARE